jgi:hypothetical protein
VTIGLPLPKDRQLSDIWSALGGELKPALDLVVTVPFPVGKLLEVGDLVTEGTVLDLNGSQGQQERVARPPAVEEPTRGGPAVRPRAGMRHLLK